MLINKDWKIESDELNVTLLHRQVKKKDGQEYWVAEGYYSSPEAALSGFIDLKIMGTGIKDYKDVVKQIKELKAEILKNLKE